MSGGRPRTPIGAYGAIALRPSRAGAGVVAETRYRDVDGRLRKVTATDRTARQATALLNQRLVDRRGYGSAGQLRLASPLGDLAELWLADLEAQDISETTKQGYRDTLGSTCARPSSTTPSASSPPAGWSATCATSAPSPTPRRAASAPCSTCCSGTRCATTPSPGNPVEGPFSSADPRAPHAP
ncbi:hypothetical protein AB3X52_10380 [Nocardioides sp. DS6]|uniref:Core-binding (CB) domain-containing protein n=1 Tax=Nocardioides eburneus TaxID=3231482 RepID=A0ABV3SYL0_9ACTN